MTDLIIQVPATSANLGPGFDSFGLALKCYNRFHLSEASVSRIGIALGTCVEIDGLPLTPGKNLFFKAFDAYYAHIGKPAPAIHLELEIHIPLARGLGSSSTAIVGGLVAANALEGNQLDLETLLQLALTLEGHPDNVAPALYGGVLLCDGPAIFPMAWPKDWKILLVIPPYPLLTETVRQVLPKTYLLEDAIFNLRKASLLTYAILQSDEVAFRRSLFDRLHQPYRCPLIPEFEAVSQHAINAGAFGTVISGAGPSIAVFYPAREEERLYQRLQDYQTSTEASLKIWRLDLDQHGAKQI